MGIDERGLQLLLGVVLLLAVSAFEVDLQLIHGGWYGGGDRPRFNTYQLNLVFGGADRPRVNVTNTANWEATWSAASALADFLGVPLLDEVSGGSAAPPTSE